MFFAGVEVDLMGMSSGLFEFLGAEVISLALFDVGLVRVDFGQLFATHVVASQLDSVECAGLVTELRHTSKSLRPRRSGGTDERGEVPPRGGDKYIYWVAVCAQGERSLCEITKLSIFFTEDGTLLGKVDCFYL